MPPLIRFMVGDKKKEKKVSIELIASLSPSAGAELGLGLMLTNIFKLQAQLCINLV
jgi:hypothetical protein